MGHRKAAGLNLVSARQSCHHIAEISLKVTLNHNEKKLTKYILFKRLWDGWWSLVINMILLYKYGLWLRWIWNYNDPRWEVISTEDGVRFLCLHRRLLNSSTLGRRLCQYLRIALDVYNCSLCQHHCTAVSPSFSCFSPAQFTKNSPIGRCQTQLLWFHQDIVIQLYLAQWYSPDNAYIILHGWFPCLFFFSF